MNNDSNSVSVPSELSIDEVMQVSGGLRHDATCTGGQIITVDTSPEGHHCDNP